MPFHRGCWTIHPVDGVTPGLWIELSTDPPGTLTGMARTDWPAIVTGGPVAERDTTATYGTKVTDAYRTLCTKTLSGRSTAVVVPTVTFSRLSPLLIADVVVDEGACRSSSVVRAT